MKEDRFVREVAIMSAKTWISSGPLHERSRGIRGKKWNAQLSETFSFGTTIVEVKVDPETGQVEVIEMWASQDEAGV